MALAIVVTGLVALMLVFAGLLAARPRRRAVAERRRIAAEVHQAQWRLQRATAVAMARLLAEGRERP